MRAMTYLLGFGLLVGALGASSPLVAADMPAYMDVIVAGEPPAPAETARQNVLALNTAMFGLYDESGRIFRKNLLGQHPVILALFNGAGGRFILYKPGAGPVEAPSVPVLYQLLKSVGHATMVISVIAGPHVEKPADASPAQGTEQQSGKHAPTRAANEAIQISRSGAALPVSPRPDQ